MQNNIYDNNPREIVGEVTMEYGEPPFQWKKHIINLGILGVVIVSFILFYFFMSAPLSSCGAEVAEVSRVLSSAKISPPGNQSILLASCLQRKGINSIGAFLHPGIYSIILVIQFAVVFIASMFIVNSQHEMTIRIGRSLLLSFLMIVSSVSGGMFGFLGSSFAGIINIFLIRALLGREFISAFLFSIIVSIISYIVLSGWILSNV